MSVCTGAFLLAEAGLLDGLNATTTYGMEDELSKARHDIKVTSPDRFVDAGKIITTAGLTSGIDGALHLVAKMLDKGRAQSVALSMEYAWDPDSRYARAALADRYLPDGLRFGKANLKGAKAVLVSTEGDIDHWETRIAVSEPGKPAEILALLGDRIKSNTNHTRGNVSVGAPIDGGPKGPSQIKWNFADDQGRGWRGVGITEPSREEAGKFMLTLRLARDGKAAHP
jgi:hypothetical protein